MRWGRGDRRRQRHIDKHDDVTEREVVGNREQAWVSIYMELHLLA
jgi:hypothetical protein